VVSHVAAAKRISRLEKFLRHPRWIFSTVLAQSEGEIPFSGGSSNGGFWSRRSKMLDLSMGID
jgi:hypothetical protein